MSETQQIMTTISDVICTNQPTIQQVHPWIDDTSSMNNCEVTKFALGVMVGLLMIVLVVVTSGWGWTCWLLKREAKRNTKLYS